LSLKAVCKNEASVGNFQKSSFLEKRQALLMEKGRFTQNYRIWLLLDRHFSRTRMGGIQTSSLFLFFLKN